MSENYCKACNDAAYILRRRGFRDTIVWSSYAEAPTKTVHGFHANSGVPQLHEAQLEKQKDGRMATAIPARTQMSSLKMSLCVTYASELEWVNSSRPSRITVYMAHPLSGDYEANIESANAWLRFLRRQPANALSEMVGVQYSSKPLILAPWLAAVDRDEQYPGGRDGALADGADTALMFDEVWWMRRITEGMRLESIGHKCIRDLTHLGPAPGPRLLLPPPSKKRNSR